MVTLPPNSLQHPLQPQPVGPPPLPPVGPSPHLPCYLPPGVPPSLHQYPFQQLLPSCGPMGVPMWAPHAEPPGAPFGGQRGFVDKDLHKLVVLQWQEPRTVLMYIQQGRFVAPLAAEVAHMLRRVVNPTSHIVNMLTTTSSTIVEGGDVTNFPRFGRERHENGPYWGHIRPIPWSNAMNSGQACRTCRGFFSLIPGRGCFDDLLGDEIIVSPPSPVVEPLLRCPRSTSKRSAPPWPIVR